MSLHIKCGFFDTEILFMLPINWLNHSEEDSDCWDPNIHSPRNYLHIFYVAALID